jgi:hypothetical protein
MKYQLVLQFLGDSLTDHDALIALEDRLTVALEPAHVVDGHDFGSGQMNIFVHSDDPLAAFAAPGNQLSQLRAAANLEEPGVAGGRHVRP